jgi:secreted trypsin-like serine protease
MPFNLKCQKNPNSQKSSRIVGGGSASRNAWNFITKIKIFYKSIQIMICGGSILSDTHILTAGHCCSYPFTPSRV